MRIKEILKEKGMTLQELADKMDVSRQALSRQVGGKLLVEKAEEIACMLDVPVWQLFVHPKKCRKKTVLLFVPIVESLLK